MPPKKPALPLITPEMARKVVDLRRQVHMYPELAYQEVKTQKLIIDELKKLGLKPKKIAGTGVTAIIPAKKGSTEKRVLMLRADMDALPVTEDVDVPFKSRHDGVMHACGHDAHVAMLLCAAKLLIENPLDGTIKLCFQPAEEGGIGAQAMIDGGIMEKPKVSAAFGLHVWAGAPKGKLGIAHGPCMAAVDEFDLIIKGIGGHAALPQYSIDPIYISSQVISALQSIISRNLDPIDTGVVTIGSIHGGTNFNIIPPEVKLQGTVRTFDKATRKDIKKRFFKIVNGVTKSLGGSAEIDYRHMIAATINDNKMCDLMWSAGVSVLGKKNVVVFKPVMGGEDMSLYLEQIPGCFAFLGFENPKKGVMYPHHHPKFWLDEDILPAGIEIFYRAAERYFKS